ncbi:unnamed protein product [Rhizophagus irregularis]|nr:unnamed protein product [Rhizophagus irregularis]
MDTISSKDHANGVQERNTYLDGFVLELDRSRLNGMNKSLTYISYPKETIGDIYSSSTSNGAAPVATVAECRSNISS